MRAILTCCWPGLTRLWYRGEWTGLAKATLFAALFNLAILARFVWPELLSVKLATITWVLVCGWWTFEFVHSLYHDRHLRLAAGPRAEERFKEGQSEYLRGHWYEAEAILREILLSDPRDLDAHLLLASLLRHTGRLDEGARQLKALERLDGSAKWWLEIEQERSRLRQARDELGAESTQDMAIEDDSPETADRSDKKTDETDRESDNQIENGKGGQRDAA